MVSRAYVPDAGDLVWLTFDPHVGHEQRGRRPALVLSPRAYNSKARLAIACPVTSHVKGYPFEVPLPPGGKISGVVLADHVKNFDWHARRVVFEAKRSLKNKVYKMALARYSDGRARLYRYGPEGEGARDGAPLAAGAGHVE